MPHHQHTLQKVLKPYQTPNRHQFWTSKLLKWHASKLISPRTLMCTIHTMNMYALTKKSEGSDSTRKIMSLSVGVTYIIWIIFEISLPPDLGSTEQDFRISNPKTPTSSTHIARRINWNPTKVQNWRLVGGNHSQSCKLLKWKCNIFSETIVL